MLRVATSEKPSGPSVSLDHEASLGPEHSRDALEFVSELARIRLWRLDPASGRLELDPVTASACGLPSVVDGDDFGRRAVRPHGSGSFRELVDKAIASSGGVSARVCVLEAGTTLRPLELRFRVCRDQAGRAVHLLVAASEVDSDDQAGAPDQRAEAERALVERLSVATQAAGIYVWEFDWDAKSICWDENRLSQRAANRHFGQELGSELFRWVHPEDQNIGRQAMGAALQAGERDASFRYRLRLPDGMVRHIQAYARTYSDPAGKPLRSLGVSWDVTREIEDAQRLARQTEQLQDAQRRLERASLSIQEGHWEIDWEAGRHWGSSNYYALLGYSPGEVEFDTFEKLDSLIHPYDLASVHAATDQHISQRTQLYDVELRLRVKDGSYRWFRLRGVAERDAQDRVVRMSGSIHDIQKQKAAEDALDEAKARFDRAVHGTQDGLWEEDFVMGRMWLSPRTHELLGYEHDSLGESPGALRDRVHPQERQAFEEAVDVCLRHELPVNLEIRLMRRGGDYRWFRVQATPSRGTDGAMRRMSGSIQDVTEAHAARDALIEASEAAQAANRSKSAFLANMSHEIRTPMNGIIGMTSLLLDSPLERSQREYAETIRSSADCLLTIINDILDFSKIEAGKLDIESVPLSLRDCVEDTGATLAFQAAAKNLELVINIHPEVPERVLGDPQRIRQCLINLIGNAVKFTRSGEIVVDVSATLRQGEVALMRFAVRDTGIGLAPETLQSLFQPFVQADVSTTRVFGGTGLGLSIVRRLVELMGGEISVQSEPGKGSTFAFTLPMQPVALAPSQPLAATRPGQRLLVVDDNETNRHALATSLAHAGYDVTLASSGREALVNMRLALAASRPFDLVLSDFQMPDMDGASLGECINADPLLSRSRVVLLTSVDGHGDIERFASLGFAGYLTKPIRGRDLRACLNRVLAREAHEWHARSYPIVTTNTLSGTDGARPFSGKVLLVEDNLVNQKVGQKFLERLGCEVRLAENGAECLAAWREDQFALVLMDIQMPVMDGYTATRQIRDLEGAQRRTPIIALTADAMSGQLERCLQCGMDGLLTKPLDPERMREVLERFGLALNEGGLQEAAVESVLNAAGPREGIDPRALSELFGGDTDFARALVDQFASSSSQILARMRELASTADRAGLAAQAHQLKGASANLTASALAFACAALEQEVAQASQPRLAQAVDSLSIQVARVNSALQQLIAQEPPASRTG